MHDGILKVASIFIIVGDQVGGNDMVISCIHAITGAAFNKSWQIFLVLRAGSHVVLNPNMEAKSKK